MVDERPPVEGGGGRMDRTGLPWREAVGPWRAGMWGILTGQCRGNNQSDRVEQKQIVTGVSRGESVKDGWRDRSRVAV